MKKKNLKELYIDLVDTEFDNLKNQEQLEISEDLIAILEELVELTDKEELTEEEQQLLEVGLQIVTKIIIPVKNQGIVYKALKKLDD
jgi:hypothetical protein